MIELTADKAWIFRITHIDNVPWVLANGLHCCNSNRRDPNFRDIGNPELIGKRAARRVIMPPGGTLSDYVPFYFTPHSIMLLNIKTGYNGLQKTPMPDIAILVTSLHKVVKEGLDFVFTDRHAYVAGARFSHDLRDLDRIDWPLLQARDFRRDPDDPGKCERYQAEALIHRVVPVSALSGIACYSSRQEERLREELARFSLSTPVAVRPKWYF